MGSSSQREAYGQALVKLGGEHPEMVVLDADLGSSTNTLAFGKKYPERFFNFGIQEQNMMGAAAGLAASGKMVFASSFAAFATGRAYDFIRQSICYSKLSVKIVATHAGITVGEDGATHQMLEDIGLMTSLPNMCVIAPADAAETTKVIEGIATLKGPFYVRLSREKVLDVTNYDFTVGKGVVARDGKDVTIISTGILLASALGAAEMLKKEGVDARVIHMPTIKPIDKDLIIKAAKETKGIVSVEEHNIYNGLGSRVAEVVSENHPAMVIRHGMQDRFGESGKGWDLMKKYGLDEDGIAEKVRYLLSAVK
jgi:transketolase